VAVAAATGQAVCPVKLRAGTRTVVASYGGDAYFGASTSPSLVVRVRTAAPSLSHVRLGARRVSARAGLALRFTLSQAALMRVSISRLAAGHKVHRRSRRISFHAKLGRNRRHLRLRGLRLGRYRLALSAVGASGRSRAVTLPFQIVRTKS